MIKVKKKKSYVLRVIFISLILLFCLMGESAIAQVRSGASFLNILPGARQQGLSGNVAALLDETYALYGNPGATGFLREHQWSVTYTRWITDIYNLSLNYGRAIRTPWSRHTRFAFGLNYQGVKEFDSSRGATPPASANDVLLLLSIGNPLSKISKNLSVGANIKYLKTNLDQYSASAAIFDVGALLRTNRFRFLPGNGGLFNHGIFSIGVGVTQMGNPMKFISTSTPLPRTFRGGIAFYTGTHSGLQLQISGDYRHIRDEIGSFGLGTEISWRRRIALRSGYNFNDRMLSKFSFGLSLRLDDVQSSINHSLTGRNNAVGFDFVALDNNDFFSNAYRTTITHLSIGPEKFLFATKPHEEYTTKDSITLAWELTKDPDLFDDVHFGYIVVRDSLKLYDFVNRVENHDVDFFEGSDNALQFKILEGQVSKTASYASDELPPLPSGDYYWAVWAYDKDRHVRFAVNDEHKIRHFRVVAPEVPHVPVPQDTAADLLITKTVRVEPVRLKINFGFNSADLNFDARKQLSMLGMALQSEALSDRQVELGGHTDLRGSEVYNQKLSQRRVNSAKDFLVQSAKVEEARITAVGYGESKPIIPNAKTKKQHAINRRVEIKFSDWGDSVKQSKKIALHSSEISYQLNLKNTQSNPARNILVTDVLPERIEKSNFNIKPVKTKNDTLQWGFKTLNPGDSVLITYKAKAPAFVDENPYMLHNVAEVSASNDTIYSNNSDSATVYVIGTPDTVIHFDFDKSDIHENAKKSLIRWAKYLQSARGLKICIEGHTDSIGSDDYNLKLSYRRANSTKTFILNWLKQQAPTSDFSQSISVKGWGEKKPIANNSSAEGRKKNRRIEIHLSSCE